ncbi:hypothetical protein N9079_03045, partial [bacterium]|nr:hypothetical protein [bacterium]
MTGLLKRYVVLLSWTAGAKVKKTLDSVLPMRFLRGCFPVPLGLFLLCNTLLLSLLQAGELVSLASFNVENYLLNSDQGRSPKSYVARRAVKKSLLCMRADVVALQEIGSEKALLELKLDLGA